MMKTQKETVIQAGFDKRITGILTQGTSSSPESNKTALILLNCGFLHHIGPYRFHVELARELAQNGTDVLRMDLAGVGDSKLSTLKASYDERVIKDVSEAMDLLQETYGYQNFIVGGICLGARNAHIVAMKDKRVTGIFAIDGHSYPNFKYYFLLNLRVFNLRKWKDFILRKIKEIFGKKGLPSKEKANFEWEFLSKDHLEDELRTLVKREVRQLHIFSGRMPLYKYEGQFQSVFKNLDFNGTLKEMFFPMADHTFTIVGLRKKLIGEIKNWV